MAGAIKGITVEIGGDTTKLGKALAEVNKKSKDLQTELKGVEKLLKFNPGNVTLLKQKQDILNESISETKTKLDALKQAMAKIDAGEVEVTEEEYRNLQREIIATEGKLKNLTGQLKDFGSVGAQQIAAVGEKMKTVGDKISSAGEKMLPATAAITGIGTASVAVASTFESSMSQVAATMGMTSDEINNGSEDYQKLEKAARDMGSATKYSASEAADALNYLALAGYDVDKSVETLPTILNLAAAGGIDLADASDMVTDAMSALGLETSQASNFVDQMAKTSQKSNTNVAQLGEAILTVGGTAKNLAGGTTELNTALGILADNGIKGAEGGTALRNIILSLSAPTDKAATAMKDLGLQVYDANGNMRPLNEIFQDLDGTLSTMSQGEQTQVLNEIFNKVDLKSVNALLANSGERFDELSGYIDNADGAAAAMADTMNNNLNGQITILKSALEEAGISIGQALLPIIKNLVSVIQSLTDKFNSLDPATKTIIVVIGGIVAAIGPLLVIVGKVISSVGTIMTFAPKLVSGINTIKSGLTALFGVIAAHPVIAIITAIIAAVVLLYTKCEWFRDGVHAVLAKIQEVATTVFNALVTFFTETIPNAIDSTVSFFQGLPDAIGNAISTAISVVSDVFTQIQTTISTIINTILTTITQVWTSIKTAVETAVNAVKDTISNVFETIKTLVTAYVNAYFEVISAVWEAIKDTVTTIIEAIRETISTVMEGISTVISTVWETIKSTTSTIWEGISSIISTIWETIKTTVSTVIESVKQNISTVWEAIKSTITTVMDTIKTTISTVWETIKSTVSTVVEGIKSVITSIFNAIKALISGDMDAVKSNLSDAWNTIKSTITTVVNNIKSIISTVFEGIKSVITTVVNNIKSTITSVWNNIKSTTTSVFNGIKNAIGTALNTAKTTAVNACKNIFNGMKNVFSTVGSTFKSIGQNVIQGIINGITGMVSKLYNSIKNALSGLVDKAKSALGINSPSRVFRDVIGAMIPPGIALGVKKTENQATDAVDDMINDLTDQEVKINGATINRKLNTTFGNPEGATNAVKPLDAVSLMTMLQNILDKLGRLQVVLDSGELVGGIIDEIDDGLSDKYNKTVRGW